MLQSPPSPKRSRLEFIEFKLILVHRLENKPKISQCLSAFTQPSVDLAPPLNTKALGFSLRTSRATSLAEVSGGLERLGEASEFQVLQCYGRIGGSEDLPDLRPVNESCSNSIQSYLKLSISLF